MCGIAGILDPSGVDAGPVRAMADALAHRGPDDEGFHFGPGVGLGFRRLAIIDLEGGNQPIPNEDGSVWVVCNGEIYNHRELRRGLERRGHAFRTRSDVEVIVHLYEELGPGLVDRIRGMFAFAVWDAGQRRLLMARDRLGQKPLYWAREGSRLYFASEIKAILTVAPRFRQLDVEALHEYLSLRIIVDPRSMFEGVRKLPPGHLLEVAPGEQPAVRRYWSLLYEPKAELTESAALERLDALLYETVCLHLESDVELGAFLSGGVDSGIVTANVARVTGGRFKTFSLGTPYGDYDERPAARAVARAYGTDHHEGEIGGGLAGLLPTVTYYLDEPADPLSVCMYRLAEFAGRHVKVVLGGDGGDELFGGYDRYYGMRYARLYARLPRSLRDGVVRPLLDRAPDGFWYKSLSSRLRWLDEVASVEEARRYPRSLRYFYFTPDLARELYTEDFARRVERFDVEASIAAWLEEGAAKDSIDRMLLADTMVRLPNHPVMILDRMTMAHGLEARSPMLDHEMAEFAATLPVRLKVRGGRRRIVEMRLAERFMPPGVLARPKQGFSSALPYLMGREFGLLFQRFLPDSRLVEAGLLRRPAIERMLREHVARETDHGNRLWLLLQAELWYRVHIETVCLDSLSEEVTQVLASRAA